MEEDLPKKEEPEIIKKEVPEIIQKEEIQKPEKKTNTWKIYGIAITILLIFAIFTRGFSFTNITGGATLNEDAAAEKALDFINNNLMITGQATLKGVKEENNVYIIELEFQGETIESYISKDGKLLFPNAIPLEEPMIQGGATATTSASATEQEIPKSDKPIAEAFVFSHCPYGLQFQKALLPIYRSLKDKVDINLVAIGAMHGEYEKIESLRQICVEKEYGKDKLWDYLEEFMGLTELGDCRGTESCINPIVKNVLKNLNIDENKINSCMDKDAESIYQTQNSRARELGIGGSPTFVINNAKVQVNRDSESIKDAICDAFNKAPSGCSKTLSNQAAGPGFGYSSSSGSTATC
ncbi:hypothetical protein CL621_01810 [archaeon]|nr:hypothetical protein [archaeon]|tara:strand:+ start:569 stop:1627 length:1059 start_codon:yes stop_codon:yes gene_type:complete